MSRIAIIEDDPTILQMYRMKFENEGFEVDLAEDGLSGIDLVKSFQPDLLLLDIQMPGIDGTETLRRIRKTPAGKTLPVIILTNVGQEEAPDELDTLEIHSYIVKADLTPKQVVERVKSALTKL